MTVITLTRQELYSKVWQIPMVHLAKDYNLSDNGLRKICKKYSIPYPNSGYWSKLKFGYKPSITPLHDKKTYNQEISIQVDSFKLQKSHSAQDRIDFSSQINENKTLDLKIKDTLHGSVPIVTATRTFLLKTHKSWEDHHKYERLDISVDNTNINRALKVFNCIIMNLNKLGYSIKIRNANESYILSTDDIEYKIRLYEKSNIVYGQDRWGQTRSFVRNGKLAIALGSYSKKEFIDTDTNKLEDNIAKILIKIEEYFYNERIELELRKKRQLEWEEQERIKLQIKQVKEAEFSKFMNFYNSAHRWNHYVILKQYYDMILTTVDPNDLQSKEWLEWAAKKLDWYNPLINAEDELMHNINKDNIGR